MIPFNKAAPIPPPITCLTPNAFEKIILNTAGNSVIFVIIINNATNMYATAIIGTIIVEILAMLLTPPKIIIAEAIVIKAPKNSLFIPKAELNAAVIVLD